MVRALTAAGGAGAAGRAAVVPGHYSLGKSGVFGVGIGITAYTLGLRHGFDADHIAVIDSTTRKLVGKGQRPLSVGFLFSLGHATIVFALGILVVLGVRGLGGAVQARSSSLHRATELIGPTVSGSFLLVSEVALLVLAGAAAGRGLPVYAILCLPILFAAGMSLLDTIDGA